MDRRHHKNKYQALKCLRKHRLATWLFPTCAMLGILFFIIVVKCVLCAQKQFQRANEHDAELFIPARLSLCASC